jgi:hypothetical protein
LRHALQQVGTGSAEAGGERADNFLGGLLDSLEASPETGLVGNVLATWWRNQPLRMAWLLAMETTKLLLQPIASRHPYALVLGAAAAGGLLVRLRPWRWISMPSLMAGLWPQVMAESIKRLPRTPRGPPR